MTVAILTGTLTAAAVLLGVWGARRIPTRMVCPECGEPTHGLRLPLLVRWTRSVHHRWCTGCGWDGWGRPPSHDSGFHWGEERFPVDFGFRFVQRDRAAPDAAPSGLSAFHWRADERRADFEFRRHGADPRAPSERGFGRMNGREQPAPERNG